MTLNPDQCYQALVARDPRFDGRFLVAVQSTGIYCRPICRVKTPLRKNCHFFGHAAAAEGAGFRPCKRCRPELAPGRSSMEIRSALARDTASQITQDFLAEGSLADLAEMLGVTDRHMRQVFQDEFGVSPVEFWQTRRLLLAKRLLTDSRLPITEVALASGFKSLRRFNALLQARYRMTPTELRRLQTEEVPNSFSEICFELRYRPPFDWDRLLAFLAARAVPGVEQVQNGAYSRTVRVARGEQNFTGMIEARHAPEKLAVSVRLSESLLPVCAVALERVRRLFDLEAEPERIESVLGELAAPRSGLRVPGAWDGFEMAVRAVLGQQISVAGARTLAGRAAARFGDAPEQPSGALTRLFPTAEQIASAGVEPVMKLGLTRKRAETLLALALVVNSAALRLEPGARVEETLERLRGIPGIGEWTAQYIAMRALAWPDAFPHTDLGVKKALGKNADTLKLAEQWRPWRAYAVFHLWAGLEKKS